MSLTGFVRLPEVSEKFSESFLMPDFGVRDDVRIKVAPLSENYAFIGIAFDYLARFMLKRVNGDKVVERDWVAFSSLDYLEEFGTKKMLESVMEVVAHCDLTMKDGFDKPSDLRDWIRAAYLLAKVDAVYRAGLKGKELKKCTVDIWDSYLRLLRYFHDMNRLFKRDSDFIELMRLSEVLSECFQRGDFVCNEICVLNPLFGRGGWCSHLVGGADADLVIDDTLIDIKVTKYFTFTREYFNQLIGYYLLHRIGGVDGFSGEISNVGVYYARHGFLFRFPVGSVLREGSSFPDVSSWFVDKARIRHNVNDKNFQELIDAWKKTL